MQQEQCGSLNKKELLHFSSVCVTSAQGTYLIPLQSTDIRLLFDSESVNFLLSSVFVFHLHVSGYLMGLGVCLNDDKYIVYVLGTVHAIRTQFFHHCIP